MLKILYNIDRGYRHKIKEILRHEQCSRRVQVQFALQTVIEMMDHNFDT